VPVTFPFCRLSSTPRATISFTRHAMTTMIVAEAKTTTFYFNV
jgi:hypothetical protein